MTKTTTQTYFYDQKISKSAVHMSDDESEDPLDKIHYVDQSPHGKRTSGGLLIVNA